MASTKTSLLREGTPYSVTQSIPLVTRKIAFQKAAKDVFVQLNGVDESCHPVHRYIAEQPWSSYGRQRKKCGERRQNLHAFQYARYY